MGILERLAEFLGGQSNSGKDFSLAAYKYSLDAQLKAAEELRGQQTAQELERIQKMTAEGAEQARLSRRRHEQAGSFRSESDIEVLLRRLDELIKQDPTRNYCFSSIWGDTGVFQRVEMLPRPNEDPFVGTGEWPNSRVDDGFNSGAERIAFKAFNTFRHRRELFDRDSIFDVAIWWDGEEKVARDLSTHGQVNRIVNKYIKYFIVETSPNGDIVFHSRVREPISRSIWTNDRDILEVVLGKAFNKPKAHVIEEQQWTHGLPFKG